METITFNLQARARKVTHNGKTWWVAPATIYPPGGGVMAGSQGPLYYPPDEQSKGVGDWNGIPLTLRHPTDQSGNPVSASADGIVERLGMGLTKNDRITSESGKPARQVDAWFDEARVQQIWPDLLPKLQSGEPVELSTGLMTTNEPVANGGTCPNTGKRYTHIARNYRPDHLAVLPDQRGACSVADGCGINVNATDNAFYPTGEGGGQDNSCGPSSSSGQPVTGLKITGRSTGSTLAYGQKITFLDGEYKGATATVLTQIPFQAKGQDKGDIVYRMDVVYPNGMKFSNTTQSARQMEGKIVKNEDDPANELFDLLKPHLGVNTYDRVRSEVTGYFKKIGAGHGKGPVHEAAQSGYQDLKVSDRHRELAKVAGDPPTWAQDVAVWQKAKFAAEAAKRGTDMAYMASVYDAMGGAILDLAKFPEDDGFDLNAFCPTGEGGGQDNSCGSGSAASQGESAIGELKAIKEKHGTSEKGLKKAAQELTAKGNEIATRLKEQQAAVKSKAEKKQYQDAIDRIGAFVRAHNAETFDNGGTSATTNEEADMDRKQMIGQLVANCDCWKGKEKVLGNAELFSDDDLKQLIANAGKVAVANTLAKGIKLPGRAVLTFNAAGKLVVKNADGEECAPDDKECWDMMKAKEEPAPATVAANTAKPATLKDWEASMPAEAKAVWNAAKKVHEDTKLAIVKRLVTNVADPEQRNTVGNRLMKKELAELEEMALLIPTGNQQYEPTPERTYNFAGAGGAPAYNGYSPEDIEVLDLPTMNWDAKPGKDREEELEMV